MNMKSFLFSPQPLEISKLSIFSLLLRIGISASMLTHGLAKVAAFDTLANTFPDPIGLGSAFSLVLAIGAEVGCSILLMLGLFTRLAVLPLIFTMFIAGMVVNAGAPYAAKELALIYLMAYVMIFALGSGKYSLDQLLFHKKK